MTEKEETKIYEILDSYINPDSKLVLVVDDIVKTVKSSSYNNKVKEFHSTFNQVVNSKPTLSSKEVQKLRLSLILEELTELAECMGSETLNEFQRMLFHKSQEVHYKCEKDREKLQPDLVGCLDALADLQYVLSGTIVSMGFEEKFDEAFEEVHNSNMSKACDSEEAVQDTIKHYANKGVESFSEHHNGLAIVLRKEDRKLLKSINYTPAKLEKFCYDSL